MYLIKKKKEGRRKKKKRERERRKKRKKRRVRKGFPNLQLKNQEFRKHNFLRIEELMLVFESIFIFFRMYFILNQ